jgi:hypothetical protein
MNIPLLYLLREHHDVPTAAMRAEMYNNCLIALVTLEGNEFAPHNNIACIWDLLHPLIYNSAA